MRCECYTIDRIEGSTAVLYDKNDIKSDIPLGDLPENIKEGDILRFDRENNIYIIDKEKTKQVKSDMEERFKRLFKKK